MKIRDFIRRELAKGQLLALKGDLDKVGLTEKVEQAGVKVIETAPEGEQAMVISMPKGTVTPFHDNVEGRCIECACEIIHRPHYPSNTVFICLPCATGMMVDTEEDNGR